VKKNTGPGYDSSDESLKNYAKAGLRVIMNQLWKNPNNTETSPSVLVISGGRRKFDNEQKVWENPLSDPICELFPEDHLLLERPHLLQHFKPAKTQNIRYLDALTYTAELQHRIKPPKIKLNEVCIGKLKKAEDEIYDTWSVRLSLIDIVTSHLERYMIKFPRVIEILKSISPKVVILEKVVGKWEWIDAAEQLNLTSIGIQNGAHYRYGRNHYPSDIKMKFTDWFLCWGPFWKEQMNLPMEDSRVIPVGNIYRNRMLNSIEDVKHETILIISQPNMNGLFELAVNLGANKSISENIVFRTHPGESELDAHKTTRLDSSGVVLRSGEMDDLYEDLASAKYQIGVDSTAIFEGLSLVKHTFLYSNKSGNEYVQNELISQGYATSFSNISELMKKIRKYNDVNISELSNSKIERYFCIDAAKKTKDTICMINGTT
jgi:hypothetical protein